jgi:hypothetical protein
LGHGLIGTGAGGILTLGAKDVRITEDDRPEEANTFNQGEAVTEEK